METTRTEWASRTVDEGADHVVGQLSMDDVVYAGSPARAGFRGFAALHDRMDANMILPGSDDDYVAEEEDPEVAAAWTHYANAVMNEVSARIVASFDGLPPCPRCRGETTITLHVLDAVSGDCASKHILTCPTCGGAGRVSSVALARFLKEEELWCDCGQTENARYVPDGQSETCSKHHWVCDHCGRIVQVG